jgi:ribosomal protein L5
MVRLKKLYSENIRSGLMKELGYKNINMVPRIEKIIIPPTEEEKFRKEKAVHQSPMTGKRRNK